MARSRGHDSDVMTVASDALQNLALVTPFRCGTDRGLSPGMSFRSPARLLRIGSFLMIAPGALFLVADSADCPDGLEGATADKDFESTCPTDLAPTTGTARFSLAAGSNGDEAGAQRDLRAAGIRAASVRVSHQASCRQDLVSFMLETSSGSRLDCSSLSLAAETSTMTCSTAKEDASTTDRGEPNVECTIIFSKRR